MESTCARALLGFSVLALGFATGCSSGSDQANASEEPAIGEEDELNASSSCGARYGEALVHYKKAVRAAREPYAAGHCGGIEDDTGRDVEDHAATAVLICPAFKDVIRTSPWAAPIREVLADLITLRSLTGELLVLRNSPHQNWTNVERFLPGTRMYANQAWGAYWIQDELQFKANGEAVHAHHVDVKENGEVVAETTPATYRVEKTGADKDPRKVIVSWGGKTETFDLVVRDTAPDDWTSAPVFELRHADEAKSFSTAKDCSM